MNRKLHNSLMAVVASSALLAFGPLWPQIAAHELMYALKNDLALGALDGQNALVAKHPRAIDIDDGTQEILKLCRIERAF